MDDRILSNVNREMRRDSKRALHQRKSREFYHLSRAGTEHKVRQIEKSDDLRWNMRFNRDVNIVDLNPVVMEKYGEFRSGLSKYLGGGVQWRDMGRMDKIRAKESMKSELVTEVGFEQVFKEVDKKFRKWNMLVVLYAIKNCKKARRNVPLEKNEKQTKRQQRDADEEDQEW